MRRSVVALGCLALCRDKVNALADGDEVAVKVLRGGTVIELKNFYFADLLRPAPPEE